MQAISNGHNGQYFTPEHLCDMMVVMQIGEGLEDGKTVCDPTCGSGRMLLAAAKLNRSSMFYGADLDVTCCNMSLVNMLLNSLKGEIAHMNTLSNEFYKGYNVNTKLVNGYHYPYYFEFTDASKSSIWLHPLKGNVAKSPFNKPFESVRGKAPVSGVQGSLF